MADRGVTVRALAIGIAVGAASAVSNVYVSLKAGWTLPVMTTAAVVGLGVARLQRRELTAVEAVIATSLASATAYATGGGNLAAVPALVLLGGTSPSKPALIGWFAATALAGTLLGPLLGRRLRDLPFPTATATATLVREGANDGPAAKSLWLAALASGAFTLARRLAGVPATLAAPGILGAYTVGLDTSLLLVGVGGLMTWTTAWSTLLGGAVTYGLIAPRFAEASYRSIVAVMVWPAASLLVASALTELALDARRLAAPGDTARSGSWWMLAPAILVVVVARAVFDMAWPVILAALPIAVAFAYVSARSMGETDVVPTKALAPLAQAILGLVGRGIVGPTIGPNLTGATAIHAADTLGSVKLAAALDVPARFAIVARLAGSVLGAVVVVFTFGAIVPDMHALPTTDLPVPGVLVWKSVASVVAAGDLPPAMRVPIALGALVGIVLALLGRVLPPRARTYVPSAMGIGSGMVLPASMALSIALGAFARTRLQARVGLAPAMAIASGVIAGESLVGVIVQLVS